MAIDWTTVYRANRGLWVALKDDEKTIVGSGKTAKEAREASRGKGYMNPILARMPKELNALVG